MRRILLVLSLVAMLGVATAAPVVANDLEPEDVVRGVFEDGSFLVSGGDVDNSVDNDLVEAEDVDGASQVASDSDVDNSVDNDLVEDEDVDGVVSEDGSFLVVSGDLDDFDFIGEGPAALEFEQEDVQSGDVEPVVDISNTGDNANLAPTVLQSANSGNVQNEQGAVLSGSEVDDIEFEGSSIEISPSAESDATQTIEQSASATR